MKMPSTLSNLTYYISDPYPCDYIQHNQSRVVFIAPDEPVDERLVSELSRSGFRRSGELIYKPECDSCQQCLSCRVPVDEFVMNSAQKKAWKRNQDLITNIIPSSQANETHFELYCRYIQARHANGSMIETLNPEQFEEFLVKSKAKSIFLEFYHEQRLIAVSVCDVFDDGISAVYTFFDPEYSKRSLGGFAILKQIEYVKQLGLRYLYLGYWIPHSRKMKYKSNYQPLELYYHDNWRRLKQPLSAEEIQEVGERLTQNMFQPDFFLS